MTGVAGNQWVMKLGKQSGKGTPQTTPTLALNYTEGFGPSPRRDIINLAETDSSRQQGDPVVVGMGVEGPAGHYLRPSEAHKLFDYLLGSTVTTGGGADKTHTASSTAAGTAGYATIYKALGSNLCDRYVDCQPVSIQIQGGAGQVLTYSIQWVGLSYTLNETMPGSPSALTEAPLVYPQVTVTKAGSATAIVDSFELNINQGRTMILGDTGYSAADIAPGQYAVSGSLSLLFENDDDYNIFLGGSAGATTPATTIASETLVILAQETAVRSVAFDMDGISVTSYAPPGNTDGAPLRVNAEFSSRRQATLAGVLETIVKNQITTV